ncbi:hypothetical protein [Sinomicrobium sp. M5D2P17]
MNKIYPKLPKKIRTIDNKWSDPQITKYKANAQPYYALVDAGGNDLVGSIGYTPDVSPLKPRKRP